MEAVFVVMIEALSQLIGCFLHAIVYRNDSRAFPRLPLLAAYCLANGVHYVEIPDFPTVSRNAGEYESPNLLIVHGEALI